MNEYDFRKEGDCGISAEDEAMDKVFSEMENDEAKLREAIDYETDCLSMEQIVDLNVLLYKLHNTDASKLIDSPIITCLYQIAKTVHSAAYARLEKMAQQKIDADIAAGEKMRCGL